MAIIKPKTRRRFLKRLLTVTGVLIVIVFVLNVWFVRNARTILKQYISEQSKGKIKLELSQLNLNIWTKALQIHEADLLSTDSLHEPITYHVTFTRLSLKVGSVWDLLLKKKLLLDSLKLYNPVIQVMQWRKDTSQVVVKDELSIPQEMGKVYNSLLSALNEFEIRRIVIDNASISLLNKMKPGAKPVTVSSIFFDLARTPIREGKKLIYQNNEQTIELRTTHQNISLPGGRHRLSFKSFNLKLFRQTVELDSCTVTAVATGKSKSNYKIFFKKLLLTGVDFAALSIKNVIKADSVYCENPFFDFNVYQSEVVANKSETPNPTKIIRELTANLNLAYVGVKNAGIHFDIYGKTKQSFFNSNKDNFVMDGFRINPDSAQPVTLKHFNMTLRDYQLYNEDSSSIFSFDSLHFINNRVVLHNFGMHSGSGRSKVRDEIDIKVPYFELSKLDWYKLIFEQNMVAKEAILNNPTIKFVRRKTGASIPGRKLQLFDALLSLDSMVALNTVSVINGQVNMKLGPATYFNVEDINFKLSGNKLLRSTTKEGLRNAVDYLSFTKGVLRLKDITARLQNARFTNNNNVYAGKVVISGQGNKIAATVNNVYIDNMQLDDEAETIEVDRLGWASATVTSQALPEGNDGNNDNSSTIHLRNIEGNNTQLTILTGPMIISTYVQTLTASSLLKKGNEMVRVERFNMVGNNLLVNSKAVKIKADSYIVSGSDSSSLTGVHVEQIKGQDSLSIESSRVDFSTDLNDLFDNKLILTYVYATAPVIKISTWDTATVTHDTANEQLPIRINNLIAARPEISIAKHRNDSVSLVNIRSSNNSFVKASGVIMNDDGMQIALLLVNATAATYTKPTGEVLGVQKGKIDIDLSDIKFGKKDGKINWSGLINNLSVQNAGGLQIGKIKNKVRFKQASLGNLNLSSESLSNFGQLMKENVSAWLRLPQGEFIDSNKTLQWYNARYNNNNRTLSIDSFIYHPTRPLDSVLAYAPYQFDYITLKTGAVAISGLDVERFERDSSFLADTVTIHNPVLTVYRDKKAPSSPIKKDKPLPVNLLKNISLPVSLQSLQLDNGTITYLEKNGKSRKQGNLVLTKVSGELANIKNSDISKDDSLLLTFKASIMDSADLTLSLQESYTDSLAGFSLRAKIMSADLSVFNPFLVPISNVKIASGVLDSVSLSLVGRQDVALGEMKMHYRKLRIQLVKDGDPDNSTFKQKVISFIANTFLIKNNNTNRKGVIYYKHLNDQSFVNYIVKTTLTGIASSIGVKKNRKYMKQYKQELKDSNLPEIKQ